MSDLWGEIKLASADFYKEIKNDYIFFGLCGILIGWFAVIQERSVELGITKNPKWVSSLFSDFFSFHAFALVFFFYIFLNSLAVFCEKIGFQKLSAITTHVELRLKQIASSIISFLSGVLTLFLVRDFLNCDFGNFLKIFKPFFEISILIFCATIAAIIVGRRKYPFDRLLLVVPIGLISLGLIFITLLFND